MFKTGTEELADILEVICRVVELQGYIHEKLEEVRRKEVNGSGRIC